MSSAAAVSVCLILAAPAFAQKAEKVVPDASYCSEQQTPVPAQGGGVICKNKLRTKADIFDSEKDPSDPCPEGTWWATTRDPCVPVVCLTKKNPASLKNFCPRAHHTHLNSGADWSHPIICVEDYVPENTRNGGAPIRPGGCQACVYDSPDHKDPKGPDWTFMHPIDKDVLKRAKERIEKTDDSRIQPARLKAAKTGKDFNGLSKPRPGAGRRTPAAWGDFSLPKDWTAQSTGKRPFYNGPDQQRMSWEPENTCQEPRSREQFFASMRSPLRKGWSKHAQTWINKDGDAPAVYKVDALSGYYDGEGYAYCNGVVQGFDFFARKIKTIEAMLSSLRCPPCP